MKDLDKSDYYFNSGIIRKSEYFDVFISYKRDNGGDHGQKLAIKLYEKLNNDGFKVWIDNEEIGFSNNFEQRIEEAILHSKKVICILSPAWLESPNCRYEMQTSIAFEKRIIPVHYKQFREELTEQKNIGLITENEWLRIDRPQEINFSEGADHEKAYNDLTSVCKLHNEITTQFTSLLCESYYWEKYNTPKSMLHVGMQLTKTKLLKSKCDGDDELPNFTALQKDFIKKSEQIVKEEVTSNKKVFIVFEHSSLNFASELNFELKLNGISTHFNPAFFNSNDQESKIIKTILSSENIIDVSTSSFSEENDFKIAFARSHNKRILRITNNDSNKVKQEDEGFNNVSVWNNQLNIDTLITIINGDEAYNEFHSNLLSQAFAWKKSSNNDSKLLSLRDAKICKDWYVEAEKTGIEPPPSVLMIDYIERSLAYAESLRKRKIMMIWTGIIGAIIIISLSVWSSKLANEANEFQISASNAKKIAEEQVFEAEKAKNESTRAKQEAAKAIEQAQKASLEAEKAERIAFASQNIAEQAKIEADSAKKIAYLSRSAANDAEELRKLAVLKTNASTQALTALDFVLDGQFTRAKEKANTSVINYKLSNSDWETDVLYNTYIKILQRDTSLKSNTNLTSFKSSFKENDTLLSYKKCNYVTNKHFNWELANKIWPDSSEIFAMNFLYPKKEIVALGLFSGKIILYNTVNNQLLDTINVGTYRITSLAFRDDGKQLVASSVDNKITLIELNEGREVSSSHDIRIKTSRRIEEVYYFNNDVIHAVQATIIQRGKPIRRYFKYPATVEKLHNIINNIDE